MDVQDATKQCRAVNAYVHSQRDSSIEDETQHWQLHDVVGAFLSGCRVSDWRPSPDEKDPAKSEAGLPRRRKVQAPWQCERRISSKTAASTALNDDDSSITAVMISCRGMCRWGIDSWQGLDPIPLQTRRHFAQSCSAMVQTQPLKLQRRSFTLRRFVEPGILSGMTCTWHCIIQCI